MKPYHIPVLVDEVVTGLNITPGKNYIDATVGGGGHAWEILRAGGIILGIDTDREALAFAKAKFEEESRRVHGVRTWKLVQGNFRNIEAIVKKEGFSDVEGILFDLGVSSHQLDDAGRGFSYRFDDAPLDLRLNQETGEDASSIVKRLSEEELYEIFAKLGEEEHSRAIAYALVRARSVTPVTKVSDIVHVVSSVVANENERNGVLSRILQALRIAVNDELKALHEGLIGAAHILVPGGRLAVISFHSLEDRAVKQFIASEEWKGITKKPIIARYDEVQKNRRARSAKLRIAEKL